MSKPMHVLSGKIMVVDDSPYDRAKLVAVVKSLGCEPIEVAHPDQVMEVAERDQPTMILVDVVMGPPNGFEVCRMLREHPATRHMPVVLCSIKASKVDHDWARRQGAMGYLAKPIDVDKTREFLRQQWSRFQEAILAANQREEKRQQLADRAQDLASVAALQKEAKERIENAPQEADIAPTATSKLHMEPVVARPALSALLSEKPSADKHPASKDEPSKPTLRWNDISRARAAATDADTLPGSTDSGSNS